MNFTLKIAICAFLSLALGIGSGFISDSPLSSWYMGLNKPFFQPPPWIFGPVWSILYALIGISLATIWEKIEQGPAKKKALTLFAIQFVLNLIWTPIFFGMKNTMLALIVIAFMWVFILLTIRSFLQLNKTAAYLLIPYICWVSFATILNAAIVYLN